MPSPVCVPSGTANQLHVQFHDSISPGFPVISGLWVNCAETGVTLSSACSYVTFYFNNTGTKSVTTPGGAGQNCADHSTHTYSSGSGSGTTGSFLDLALTR